MKRYIFSLFAIIGLSLIALVGCNTPDNKSATFLSDEEHELLQYYNELSKKDRRWIMGQMIDLIKKADEKDMEIPKAQ